MTLAPTSAPGLRRKYRPPIGIPIPRQNRVVSATASVILHAIILLLLLGPLIARDMMLSQNEGAGGKGPAGGGGGGKHGAGTPETATYVQVAPPPPPVAKQPNLQPQLVPPPVVKPPEPQLDAPPVVAPLQMATSSNPLPGSGGIGNDGTSGNGPGSGGGRGSGIGTGTGSATGPGTGGGSGRVYPPTVTHLAMLPVPVPAKVRPYTLVAVFEVDEQGNAKLLHFNESKDSGYNKKIRAMLEEIRFRPAVKADGTPVRDTTSIIAEARL